MNRKGANMNRKGEIELTSFNMLLEAIHKKSTFQKKSLEKYIKSCSLYFLSYADSYVEKYIRFVKNMGHGIDFIANAYLRMVKDILVEQTRFLRDGKYRYSNSKDAYENVYKDKEYMFQYMIGVALSQFLWKNHRDMFLFFQKHIKEIKGENYLEIGPGHGLFFLEAISSDNFNTYCAVDISEASLNMTKLFIESCTHEKAHNIHFVLGDINEQELECKYSFITLGEVLEHVDNPKKLLHSIYFCLENGGKAYISTCANCPVIDHVYLYRTIDEIKMDIESSGLEIIDEVIISIDDVPQERWKAEMANLSYACLVTK